MASEDIEILCKGTRQDVASCIVKNSSPNDLILLLSDGSLEGPVFGESYVYLSIGDDRYESVLQYGPIDRPLWKGNHIHPSACITSERLGETVMLASGESAAITLGVSTAAIDERLQGHLWRMKFKTVAATVPSVESIAKEIGSDWEAAVSRVRAIPTESRLVLTSSPGATKYLCDDDELRIADAFIHVESPPFEVHRFGTVEE